MSVSDKILELRTHREAIREAINDKGVDLAEGSPMSDYAGAINEISGGGEIDYTKVNRFVKELEYKDGVVGMKSFGGNTLVLPQEPHEIGYSFLFQDNLITTLVNTEYITKIGNGAFQASNISGEYDFSNVTEIGYDAFRDSIIPGDLSFPKVTTLVSTGSRIGQQFHSSKITSIDLPLAENLPYATFYSSSNLKAINIPNIKTINYYSFAFLKGCEAIILGETIPTIEGGTSFSYFLTGSYAPDCKIQVPPHMVDAYKEDTFWSQYAGRIIPYLELPEGNIYGEGLTSIEGSAYRYRGIQGNIIIADSVESIGTAAFMNNPLKEVSIHIGTTFESNSFPSSTVITIRIPEGYKFGEGQTSIEGSAYRGKGITGEITIADGVTSIGNNVFSNNQITSVALPDSLESVGGYAFYNNPLEEVSIHVGTTYESSSFPDSAVITLRVPEGYIFGEGQTSIEDFVFRDKGITGAITIADGVTSIESGAFYTNQITSVYLPESLESIEQSAFMSNQLTSIVIPDSVTSIGNYAFYDNPLTEVSIGPNTSYDSDAFPLSAVAVITVREV